MVSHPELQRRWDLLVARTWMFGAELWVEASTRSEATQRDLYERWKLGLYKVPIVANPDHVLGGSPWGWPVRGSYHMVQADGYSHALDVGWRGITQDLFESVAATCGLLRTETNEAWHYQWWDTARGIYPVDEPKGDIVDLARELTHLLGPRAQLGEDGIIRLPLINDTLDGTDLYPLGETLIFIHEELKRKRLAG